MKIDRLLAIIAILQQHKTVTARYLAEKFEVSRRTILRDIEAICQAGIPIVTTQGINGGISLMDGYTLDTTVFTDTELRAIFAGLRSLYSVSLSPSAETLAQKLGGDSDKPETLRIDLGHFDRSSLTLKLKQLQNAIKEQRLVSFQYYYPKGETFRTIEPYQVLFQWSDWYVFGFCLTRQDFRLFKLRRLWDLRLENDTYSPRLIPEEAQKHGTNMTDDYYITALYDPDVKYHLVEEYGPHSFTVQPDGKLLARWGFTTREDALFWFLRFGDKVQVLDPPEMVEKMKTVLKNSLQQYKT